MSHVLIIGGMGPQASVYVHHSLVRRAHERGAVNNEDYPRVTHLSINVPDFISDTKRQDDALTMLLNSLSDINLNNIDTAFIACNTAHLLYENIAEKVGTDKMLSVTQITQDHCQNIGLVPAELGLLATPSTIKSKLYKASIIPDRNEESSIEDVIRHLIANESPKHAAEMLKPIIDAMLARGAKAIILGCSELSMLKPYLCYDELIDPMELTVGCALEGTSQCVDANTLPRNTR